MMIVWVLAGWLASSVAFGALWVLLATSLKAARRRWPQLAVDLASARPPLRRVRYRAPQARASELGGSRLARPA